VLPLIARLKDNVPDVRRAAAEALALIGPAAKDAIPMLIRTVGEDNWRVHRPAAEALKAITGEDFDTDAERIVPNHSATQTVPQGDLHQPSAAKFSRPAPQF